MLTITKFSYTNPIQQLQVKKERKISESATAAKLTYWLSAGGALLRLQHN
jgi:hypothetical protein